MARAADGRAALADVNGGGAHTHGLAGNATVPDWPRLTPSEVAGVLAAYPALGQPARIQWHSPRPFSAAARVATQSGEVFVKRQHRSVRSAEDLATEHAFMAHLRARGIPVPPVFATTDGSTVVTLGPWVYELHAIAAGLDVYRDRYSWVPLTDLGQARTAGRMLACVHRAAAGFTAAARASRILVGCDDVLCAPDPVAALVQQCAARPALADWLAHRDWRHDLAPLLDRQRMLRARLAAQPRLWTHNDWHASNLWWGAATPDAAITAVIDFGLAAPTFALYDLATAIERNAIAWLRLDEGMDAAFPRTARAILAGYADVAPLAPDDRALVADLLPIVHLDYALSEVEYYHGITHSDANAAIAYDTFLLGHAQWFDGTPGRALLEALRDPA